MKKRQGEGWAAQMVDDAAEGFLGWPRTYTYTYTYLPRWKVWWRALRSVFRSDPLRRGKMPAVGDTVRLPGDGRGIVTRLDGGFHA